MIFSDETWVIILRNLSIPELMKLRLVSRHFKKLIEYVLNTHPGWEVLAKENISIEWLEDVMVKACPYDLIGHQNEIHDPALWRKTYLSFIDWQKILVNTDVIFNNVPSSEFGIVTYTTTFDKYLLLTFEYHVVEVYTFLDDDPFKLLFSIDLDIYVIQAEFWQSCGTLLVVFQDRDGDLAFWDIDKNIEITNNDCSSRRISRNGCRDFCIGEDDGIITSFERNGNVISPGQSINLELTEDEEVLIHTVHKNNISILTCEDDSITLHNYEVMINNGMVAEFKLIDQKGPINLLPPTNRWAKFSILHTDYFYATNDYIGFATNYHLEDDDSINFQTLPHWGDVTSATMHAQLVILGCEDSSIRLFPIKNHDEMMMLYEDLTTVLSSRRIKVSDRPIFFLNLWKFEDKMFIVAITDESINLIRFI